MKSCLIVLAMYLAGISFPVVAAGGAPNIGDIPRAEPPRQQRNTPPATIKKQHKPAYETGDVHNTIKLVVREFKFTGNQSFTSEALNELAASFVNRQIDFKDLNQVTKNITALYRDRGYFLAQAYLPAQEIKAGVVEVAIVEGMLGTLSLNGAAGFDADFMNKMAAYQLASGNTVSEKNLVRNVTLLNALPATRATAQLNPAEAIGATDADITLKPLPRLQGYIGANTYGNRFTGREVAVAGISWNNPIGRGDQLSLNLKRSNDNGQRGLNLNYITPIHASGTLFSAGYHYIDYKLGGSFKALNAFGESQYFNMALDQPIFRDARKGVSAHFGVSYKKMNDEVEIIASENRRNIAAMEFGLLADWLSEAGNVSHQVGFNARTGHVHFKDDVAEQVDRDATKTKGGFAKYNLTATRTQFFSRGVSLALRADYQRASKNLDSVEKIATGGINRWRQFAELPSLADTGLVVGAELRKSIPANATFAKWHLIDITPYGFIDLGRGKVNQKTLASDNHVKSIHGGIGLDARFQNDWLLSVTGSHQNRDFSGADAENEARVWGQLIKYF